jgi:predicted lipid-binding transport protein (Tim44 family)
LNAFARIHRLLAVAVACITASIAQARGGGGCLERGTLVDTPRGPVAVEQLRIGDTVWGIWDGMRTPVAVEATYEVHPDSYVELTAGGTTLRVTPEHPIEVAPGVFVRADRLLAQTTLLFSGEGRTPLIATRPITATTPAYNLLVSPGGVYFANGLAVHNKGCFLPDTPITMADGTRSPISTVAIGAKVLAFDGSANLVVATVRNVLTHQVASYLVLRTEQTEVRVTEEHPFYVGDGTFKTAEALRLGDVVYVYDGQALVPQHVLALERVRAAVTVYNLQTDEPHTFLANGIAVHNKGGGCFAAGTLVQTPSGNRAIESLALGDTILGYDESSGRQPVVVEGIYQNRSPLFIPHTDHGTLATTTEHPLLDSRGDFRTAETFRLGGEIETTTGIAKVLAIERRTTVQPVYTLTVSGSHTFTANGFVVHNKGGGGFGGGFHSSGGYRTGGGPFDPTSLLLPLIFVAVLIIVAIIKQRQEDQNEELDYCFSRSDIEGKSAKTAELLTFISKVDDLWKAAALEARVRSVFVELQTCWSNRAYDAMQPLMVDDLYQQHCAQLRGLRETHEINLIESLQIDAIDLVHVNYTERKMDRSFTALITATARDYYVDDRTNEFLRGDTEPQSFQEFWTFQLFDREWKLREIEQTKESDVLTTENFFEQFTEVGRDQIYGDAAGATGPAGPALPSDVKTKANKIDRLLNFLVQTDKIWNRDEMLATSRRVFLNVQLAWQDGRPEMLSGIALSAEMRTHLEAVLTSNRDRGLRVEHRNLCVRKVEIVQVDNRDDRTLDAFTARITAHAQTIITGPEGEIRHDEWVQAWTEFWTFGRDGTTWVLKDVLPEADAQTVIARENVDEGSSQQMLEWYYSKPRAT